MYIQYIQYIYLSIYLYLYIYIYIYLYLYLSIYVYGFNDYLWSTYRNSCIQYLLTYPSRDIYI